MNTRHKKYALVFGFAAIAAVTLLANSLARLQLGNRTVNMISSASSLECYRVVPDYFERHNDIPFDPKKSIDNCTVLKSNLSETDSFKLRLKGMLLSPFTYDRDRTKCRMDPGVIFRLRSTQGTVDVVLCFQCDQMLVIGRDSKGATISNTESRLCERAEFLALAKSAFPEDNTLK